MPYGDSREVYEAYAAISVKQPLDTHSLLLAHIG
jgi:hypothetical protein